MLNTCGRRARTQPKSPVSRLAQATRVEVSQAEGGVVSVSTLNTEQCDSLADQVRYQGKERVKNNLEVLI